MERARTRVQGGRGIRSQQLLSYEVHRIVGLSDHPLADGLFIAAGVRGFTTGITTAGLVPEQTFHFNESPRNRPQLIWRAEQWISTSEVQRDVRRNASCCSDARARLGSSAAGQEKADLESASDYL